MGFWNDVDETFGCSSLAVGVAAVALTAGVLVARFALSVYADHYR